MPPPRPPRPAGVESTPPPWEGPRLKLPFFPAKAAAAPQPCAPHPMLLQPQRPAPRPAAPPPALQQQAQASAPLPLCPWQPPPGAHGWQRPPPPASAYKLINPAAPASAPFPLALDVFGQSLAQHPPPAPLPFPFLPMVPGPGLPPIPALGVPCPPVLGLPVPQPVLQPVPQPLPPPAQAMRPAAGGGAPAAARAPGPQTAPSRLSAPGGGNGSTGPGSSDAGMDEGGGRPHKRQRQQAGRTAPSRAASGPRQQTGKRGARGGRARGRARGSAARGGAATAGRASRARGPAPAPHRPPSPLGLRSEEVRQALHSALGSQELSSEAGEGEEGPAVPAAGLQAPETGVTVSELADNPGAPPALQKAPS